MLLSSFPGTISCTHTHTCTCMHTHSHAGPYTRENKYTNLYFSLACFVQQDDLHLHLLKMTSFLFFFLMAEQNSAMDMYGFSVSIHLLVAMEAESVPTVSSAAIAVEARRSLWCPYVETHKSYSLTTWQLYFLHFGRTFALVLQWLGWFTVSPAVSMALSPHIITSTCHCFSGDSRSERGEMDSQTVLICISLMSKDFEHIFHIFIGRYWPSNSLIGWLCI